MTKQIKNYPVKISFFWCHTSKYYCVAFSFYDFWTAGVEGKKNWNPGQKKFWTNKMIKNHMFDLWMQFCSFVLVDFFLTVADWENSVCISLRRGATLIFHGVGGGEYGVWIRCGGLGLSFTDTLRVEYPASPRPFIRTKSCSIFWNGDKRIFGDSLAF